MPSAPGETAGPGERVRSDDSRLACEATVSLGRAAPLDAVDGPDSETGRASL